MPRMSAIEIGLEHEAGIEPKIPTKGLGYAKRP
jgi:hypothetical protein